jgi:Na+/H+ antiporter NhaA
MEMEANSRNINRMTIENATYALPLVIAITTVAGVLVSVITFIFERKKFNLTSKAEDKKFRLVL